MPPWLHIIYCMILSWPSHLGNRRNLIYWKGKQLSKQNNISYQFTLCNKTSSIRETNCIIVKIKKYRILNCQFLRVMFQLKFLYFNSMRTAFCEICLGQTFPAPTHWPCSQTSFQVKLTLMLLHTVSGFPLAILNWYAWNILIQLNKRQYHFLINIRLYRMSCSA